MRKWLIAFALVSLIGAAFLVAFSPRLSPYVRDRAVQTLRERFESEVEFDQFDVSIFPRVGLSGTAMVFRHKGRTDVAPLLQIAKFSAHASLLDLLSTPMRVRRLYLDGLTIHVPARKDRGDRNEEGEKDSRPGDNRPGETDKRDVRVLVDEIHCDNTQLNVLPKRPEKPPLMFDIHRLTLRSVGKDRPLSYQAALSNPQPRGEIQASGEFGPWNGDEPGLTPVSGTYTFDDADLATFKGIGGILSSAGQFRGVLERIEVEGETETPDFRVGFAGNPVPLHTEFHAIVDGTNGDTLLQPVHARINQSSLIAKGGVVSMPGRKGKTIHLDVTVSEARLQDLLRLAVKGRPPMTGAIVFNTKFELPPGEEEIVERLLLNGNFNVDAARFTDVDVQEQIDTLSRRGQARPEDRKIDKVVSDLSGRFALRDGVMRFSILKFSVQGAAVELNGHYGLESERLDFRGLLRLQAKLSETTTGLKSLLLKPIDPFFRKDGQTVLRIKVTGTREEPAFGLNLRGKK